MNRLVIAFLLFIIFSFVGWLLEVTCFFIYDKKIVNRGFLLGPYCPVYGISAILIVYLLESFKHNLILLFLLSILICMITEYFISYLCEKLFKARWWDYSNRKFNINGRIYLPYSILFGFLGLITVGFIAPLLFKLLKQIPIKILYVYFFILLIIFIADLIASIIIMFKVKDKTRNIKKDSTEEINIKVKKILEKQSWHLKRILIDNLPINLFKIKKQ